MKIVENGIERDCCLPQDMRPYKGATRTGDIICGGKDRDPKFCIHCGQIWLSNKCNTTTLGYIDLGDEKLPI